MISVYIIVVTYNAEAWLPYFTKYFSRLPEGWQLIVIDNASSDNTCQVIVDQYPYIELVKSTSNLGFGKANNLALKLAMEKNIDYVFLLNQDACISVEDIQKCISAHQKYPQYFIVSPVHMNGKDTDLDCGFVQYALPRNCPHFYADAINGRLKEIYTTSYVNAAGWLLPQKTLQTIGGFNPLFIHYGEDDDYINRTLYHSGEIGIVPNAFLYHSREERERESITFITTKNNTPYTYSLINFLNINNNNTIKNILSYYIKYIIKSCIKLKPKHIFFIFLCIFTLLKNRRSIQQAKEITKKKQATFLE